MLVAPTRSLCPFSPGTRGQALDEREERGPGDAEAVACVATLAGAPAERRGFLGGVEQPLDRTRQRGHVPRRDHEATAVQDLGGHGDGSRDAWAGEGPRGTKLYRHLSHSVR